MKFQPSTEFPYISKEKWLEHLAASLKEGTLQDLYPYIDGRTYPPFVHYEEVQGSWCPVLMPIPKSVIAGLSFDDMGSDPLHQALQHGVQSLSLSYKALFTVLSELRKVAHELPKPFILDLKGGDVDHIDAVNEAIAELPVVVHANLPLDATSAPHIAPVFTSKVYPYTCVIDCRSNAIEALAEFLYRLSHWSIADEREGEFPIVIEVVPHAHVLYQIALIRAMRWLIAQWKVDTGRALRLEWKAYIPATKDEDPHLQLIELSWRVFAVAVGGIAHITAVPKTSNLIFHLAAAHIVHLLQYESRIWDYPDVGRGSYWIESTSRRIAQMAWQMFVDKWHRG